MVLLRWTTLLTIPLLFAETLLTTVPLLEFTISFTLFSASLPLLFSPIVLLVVPLLRIVMLFVVLPLLFDNFSSLLKVPFVLLTFRVLFNGPLFSIV